MAYDPQQPPPGYSWAGQPPQSLNPFLTAGTSMIQDYAAMKQQQEIAQYQQLITPPPNMSMMAQSNVAMNPLYQFGVMGGQFGTYNNMQNNIGPGAFMMAAGGMALQTPLWAGAQAGVEGLLAKAGISGTLGGVLGFAGGMAAGSIIGMPIQMFADRGIERARFQADIARDINDYSPMMTGGRGYGRQATRALSRDMMEEMNDQMNFFRPEDQLKVMKMGMSSGMIKGRDTDEFKRSFEELKSAAKDVVVMLNTTIEGGMSVMQELKKSGFSDASQIRNTILQARTIGATTGIGTQNALGIAAAGAQNAMGTGWSAVAGAGMYSGSLATLGNMSMSDPAMRESIRAAGGISEASGMVGSGMMNALRSGLGIQTLASVMNPTTKQFDADRMQRLASGDMSAGDIISAANEYGLSGGRGGANNRALVGRDIQRRLNESTYAEQVSMFRGMYSAWAGPRGGRDEASAYVFAGQFSSNPVQQDLLSGMLMNPVGFENMQAQENKQQYLLRMAETNQSGSFVRSVRMGMSVINADIGRAATAAFDYLSNTANLGGRMSRAILNSTAGSIDPSGAFFSKEAIATQGSGEALYGSNVMTQQDLNYLGSMSKESFNALTAPKSVTKDVSFLYRNDAATNTKVLDLLGTAAANGTSIISPIVNSALGVSGSISALDAAGYVNSASMVARETNRRISEGAVAYQDIQRTGGKELALLNKAYAEGASAVNGYSGTRMDLINNIANKYGLSGKARSAFDYSSGLLRYQDNVPNLVNVPNQSSVFAKSAFTETRSSMQASAPFSAGADRIFTGALGALSRLPVGPQIQGAALELLGAERAGNSIYQRMMNRELSMNKFSGIATGVSGDDRVNMFTELGGMSVKDRTDANMQSFASKYKIPVDQIGAVFGLIGDSDLQSYSQSIQSDRDQNTINTLLGREQTFESSAQYGRLFSKDKNLSGSLRNVLGGTAATPADYARVKRDFSKSEYMLKYNDLMKQNPKLNANETLRSVLAAGVNISTEQSVDAKQLQQAKDDLSKINLAEEDFRNKNIFIFACLPN